MNILVNNNTVERKKAASELFAPWFSLRDSKVENSDIWSDNTWVARMVHPKDDGGWGFQDMNASSTYAPAVEKLNDAITLMQGRLGTTNTLADAATRKLRIRNWAGRATRLKEIGVESATSSLITNTDNNTSSPTSSVILRISANKYYEFQATSGNLQMRTCSGNPVDKTGTIGSWTNIAVTNIHDVHGAAFIDTNKIFVYMKTSTSTYRVAGVVVTVSGDAYASNGTVNELSAAFTTTSVDGKDACCKLDTDKAAVILRNTSGNSYRPIIMVATVSGTTITWQHAAAYSYGSGSFSNSEQICIKQLDTNVAVATATASNDLYTFGLTFSGSTPSVATVRNDGQSSGTHIFMPFVISSTRFGVFCGYGAAGVNSRVLLFNVAAGVFSAPTVTVSLSTSDVYTFTHITGDTFYYMTDTYITEMTYNGTDAAVVRSYPHNVAWLDDRSSQIINVSADDEYIQVLASFIHYRSISVTVNDETPVVCSGYDIDSTTTTGYFALNFDSDAEGEFYISITQSTGSSMTLVLGDLNVIVK